MFNKFYQEFLVLESQKSLFLLECMKIDQKIKPQDSYCWFGGKRPQGMRVDALQYDKSADIYLNKSVATFISLAIPKNETWHKLQARDNNTAIQSQLDEVNEILFKYRTAPLSNFDTASGNVIEHATKYCDGILFVDRKHIGNGQYIPHYNTVHTCEFVCVWDAFGNIVRAYRRVYMTPTAIKSKWPHADLGGNSLNDEVLNFFDDGDIKSIDFNIKAGKPLVGVSYATDGTEITHNPDLIPVLHVVVKVDEGQYKSYTYLKNTGQLLEEGGYSYMPYLVFRYNVAVNETWGRSPAYNALPLVSQLNILMRGYMNYVEYTTRPMVGVEEAAMAQYLKAGAIITNAFNKHTGRLKIQQVEMKSDLNHFQYMMDYLDKSLKGIFNIQEYDLLSNETSRDITATEVNEYKIELSQRLAPQMARFQSDFCNKLLLVELAILSESGIIDNKFINENVDIIYNSPYNQARNLSKAATIVEMVNTVIEMEKGFPSIQSYFQSGSSSIGQVIQEYQRLLGIDERLILQDDIIQQVETNNNSQQQPQGANPQGPNNLEDVQKMLQNNAMGGQM